MWWPRSSRMRNAHRQPRDFAVLFRTNEQTRAFETEFRKAKVPYVLIGGMSFFDRKEVQDVICYLRLANETPDDTSVLRILNRPPRRVGKKAIEKLTAASIKEKKTIWELIANPSLRPGGIESPDAGLNELVRHVQLAREKIERSN